jgi:hypothetical protein
MYNGRVPVIDKSPEFFRDVFPPFSYTILIISAHIIYFYTLNPLILLTLVLGFNLLGNPHTNLMDEDDKYNLSRKSEKAFMNDLRFLIPLYAIIVLETLTWIWALTMMSDKVHIKLPFFETIP